MKSYFLVSSGLVLSVLICIASVSLAAASQKAEVEHKAKPADPFTNLSPITESIPKRLVLDQSNSIVLECTLHFQRAAGYFRRLLIKEGAARMRITVMNGKAQKRKDRSAIVEIATTIASTVKSGNPAKNFDLQPFHHVFHLPINFRSGVKTQAEDGVCIEASEGWFHSKFVMWYNIEKREFSKTCLKNEFSGVARLVCKAPAELSDTNNMQKPKTEPFFVDAPHAQLK